jgi:hypothetical protein
MLHKNNPFIYNVPVPPEKFVGRSRQIAQILDQLTVARVSSAISGDPRVGKTSLLHFLSTPHVHEAHGISAEWCHFIYVDCHNIVPFSEPHFWKYILRELAQYFSENEELVARIQTILSQSTPDIFDLNSLSDQIAQAGHLVVLMLDEFEGVIENLTPESPDLLYHLRALLNRPQRGLTLIVASRKPLESLCAEFRFTGSPFDNSFSAITLLPFREDEVEELLSQYNVTLSESDRALLHKIADTHPFLIQRVGAAILRIQENYAVESVSLSQLEEAIEEEIESHFADLLSYSSGNEMNLLIWLALAELTQQSSDDAPKLEIPQNLGRYERDLRRLTRRRLVRNRPESLLFSPMWTRWLLHKRLLDVGREFFSEWSERFSDLVSSDEQQYLVRVAEAVLAHPDIITEPERLPQYLVEEEDTSKMADVPDVDDILIAGSVFLSDAPTRKVIKQLFRSSDQVNVVKVRLDKEFTGGLSGAQVYFAQPIDNRDRPLAHQVIKVAPATMLRREYSRYRRYVRSWLPATAVRLENGPVESGRLGCLSYGFAGDRPVGAIEDLEIYYRKHSADDVIETLIRLMEALDTRWYGQMDTMLSSFADQYGQQLPDHLWIQAEQITPKRLSETGTHRFVDLQAFLSGEQEFEIGEQVVITGLEVSQVMPNTVKLCRSGDDTIWVRASVNSFYRNLNEKDQVSVQGIIKLRRDDVFNTVGTKIMNFVGDIRPAAGGMLQFQDLERTLHNPLSIYKEILKQPLNYRKSIIHGDLHPGNILVDESGRSWLIDFDHVREAHILYDFIRLETILRLFVLGDVRSLAHRKDTASVPPPMGWPYGFTLTQYIAFEEHLLQQTLGQTSESIDDPELQKLAKVILAIRELGQHYLRQRNNWHEYLSGLFLQSLAQLRFYQDEPWLGVLPFTTAAIVGDAIFED